MKSTQVLIIGAGPTGMTAALLLAKSGIRSILIEKRKYPGKHPKAHEISGRTLEIFAQIGIPINELQKQASSHAEASRISFCLTLSQEIGSISLLDTEIQQKYQDHSSLEFPYLNVSQTKVEEVLRKHVYKNKMIEFITGCEWIALDQTKHKVYSEISDNGRKNQIESDYIISCEGAQGDCRKKLGIAMEGPDRIQDFANAFFRADLRKYSRNSSKLYFLFQPECAGTFISHKDQQEWVYHVPIQSYESIQDFDENRFIERIRLAVGDPQLNPSIESISSWRMTAQVARKFRKDRVFLAGDSAHRFPPTGGLGLNSGVADVHNLCWKIASVLKGENTEKILDTYEQERKPVVIKNCKESKENYQRILTFLAIFGINVHLFHLISQWIFRPITFIHSPTGKMVSDFFLRKAGKKISDRMNKDSVSTEAGEVIQAQVGHFDRIGLDLGVNYSPRFEQDSNPQTYQPGFEPGQRLPHFKFLDGKKLISSHSILKYNRFTLICGSKSENYQMLFNNLGLSERIEIREAGTIVEFCGTKSSWKTVTQTSPDGAILVRPDGHILCKFQHSGISSYHVLETLDKEIGVALTKTDQRLIQPAIQLRKRKAIV